MQHCVEVLHFFEIGVAGFLGLGTDAESVVDLVAQLRYDFWVARELEDAKE